MRAPLAQSVQDQQEAEPRRRESLRGRGFGIVVQALAALGCWAALGAVVYYTDPGDEVSVNGPARASFVLALFGALFFTLMPILRTIFLRFTHSRLLQERSGPIAARQALMVAAFVVLNALLQMVRAWTSLIALLLLGMFAVIEIVALARR